jgi:hypothetical protein
MPIALVGRDLGVALGHRPLDFNGKIHCVDGAPKLDNRAVAGALDDPAVMHRDGWIDEVASERLAEREKSRKIALCAAIWNLSLSFRTASVDSGPIAQADVTKKAASGGTKLSGIG